MYEREENISKIIKRTSRVLITIIGFFASKSKFFLSAHQGDMKHVNTECSYIYWIYSGFGLKQKDVFENSNVGEKCKQPVKCEWEKVQAKRKSITKIMTTRVQTAAFCWVASNRIRKIIGDWRPNVCINGDER